MIESILFWLQTAVLGYFGVLNLIYLGFTAIAFFDLLSYDRRTRRRKYSDVVSGTTFKPISIIIPAYNEGQTVVSNVNSTLEVGYPEFEVIVVNDGSTDDTLELLKQSFSLFPVTDATRAQLPTREIRGIYRSLDFPNLTVIDKENGGKSDALNAGLNVSSFPLFCTIDADSLLNADALARVARPFAEDDRIIAAGGIVRVLNGAVIENDRVVRSRAPNQLIVLCQTIEYVRGFLTGRTALGRLQSLMIISGAFALFQKARVIHAGGFSTRTVCEDMELVVRLHRHSKENKLPMKAIFVPDPVCWTQVPDDWRSLLRQRDRWQRGLVESIVLNRRMMLNPRYGAVGMIGMPFYGFFEAFGPIIETLGYLLIPVLWLLGVLDPGFLLLFFVLAVLYNITLSLLALLLDDLLFQRYDRVRDLLKMILGAFVEYFGFRQLLTFRRAWATVTGLFRRQRWGKIKRSPLSSTPKPRLSTR